MDNPVSSKSGSLAKSRGDWRGLWRYAVAVGAVGLAAAVRGGLTAWVGEGLPTYITFYPAVMLVALLTGFGPGLLATVTAALAADYWLLPPPGLFGIASASDAVGLALFTSMGVFMSVVAELYRRTRRAYDLERAEAALRESEERQKVAEAVAAERQRFHDVLDRLPAYVILLSPDYHVPFANRFFEERFGKSEGRRCYEYLFNRTEPCEICETYSVLKTHAPHRWEWTGPDGRNYDIYDFPFTDADGSKLIMEVGLDITERKRAEEALRRASAYNRSLLEASLDPLVTIGPDGKITDVNGATETATGSPRAALIGTDFSDYFSEPEKARAGYQQVFREGFVRDYPLELRHRDGRVMPVLYNACVYRDDTGKVVGVFAAARDITERKRAEAALKEANERLEQRVAERTGQLQRTNDELRESQAAALNLMEDADRARRQAEQAAAALRQSEERLKFVLDTCHIGAWDMDTVDQTTIRSPEHDRIYGYETPLPQWTYETFLEHVVPEDRARVDATYQEAVRHQSSWSFEFRIRRPDGQVRWIWATGSHKPSPNRRPCRVAGIVLDITERKRAEEALRRSRDRVELLSRTVSALLTAPDPQAVIERLCNEVRTFLDCAVFFNFLLDPEKRRLRFNACGGVDPRLARKVEGLELGESLCGTAAAGACRVHAEELAASSDPRSTLVRSLGIRAYACHPLLGHQGEVIGTLSFGARNRDAFDPEDLELMRMVTDHVAVAILRRRGEVALREAEEQFRTLADSIPNLAWWANGDGYITWYNRRWYEYTGTTPEQMEGWGWQSVHDPEMLPKVLERWKGSIATGQPFDMEFPLRGADGQFRIFLTRVQPLKDAQGRVARWFGTNTDVDELKRSEEALRQSEERLKLSLREKEAMLKEIHHRVKNNLQVIASLVDLQTNALANPALQGLFQDVRDRVRSMALVHEKLYRSESLARVEFADYARSLLNYLARSHGGPQSAIELKMDLQPVSLSVEIAVPCGLVLNELVSNAFKHAFRGRAGGEVTAALGTGPDGRVFLRVSDNGVGLPAGMDWRQSRSMGLRLVHLLAGQLGATVEARTEGGTEFEMSFKAENENLKYA